MMGRREAVARGLRAMEEESHGGRRGLSLRAARAREAEETRGGRMGVGGGGRRRPLQAVVRRAAAGRHGGPWSVLALLPSCAACASRERVRPAAWRRRGAALSRDHLCPRSCGGRKVCGAWLRGESALVARACEVVGRCEVLPRAVRGSLRHAPMPCSPVCAEERKKCTRAEERGSFFAEQRADGGGGEARRDDEKGGGALFCLRPQWVVLRGRGLWVLRGSVRVRFARWYAPGGGQE